MKKNIPILLIIFVMMYTGISAQINVQNTGTFYIASATDTFFVTASLTNASGAALTNNGALYVKQNISNAQSSMAVGTGTLFLNGSSAQSINGTQVFKTYNLVTNNAAGITLNNNLSVTGAHTYTAGMITTSATPNYMVYEAGSSYTGSSDSRHVNGWVKKTGSTNFTFPVGDATYERPIALASLTASGEFNVRYSRTTPNRIAVYNPLVYVDSAEYWTINKISGAAAQIAMNWDNSKTPFPNLMVSDIRVANFDGTFWRSIGGSATGSALTTGNITSSSVSAFNRDFTFGSIAYTLPIKIISFTAGRMNDYTKLNWTIGSELNVANYELQRSDDGIVFYTINIQLPYNRNGTEFYSYYDQKILNGTAFYRLKINNLGSQVNYSPVVTVSANTPGNEFYVITNPVTANIDLYAGAAIKGLYNYTIVNTAGQVLQAGTLDIKNAGTYSIYLKPTIVAGAYILVVQNETNKLQKMIIKK
jgi:hypothetical protein